MKIDLRPLALPNCYSSRLQSFQDDRGNFLKLFHDIGISACLPGFVPREIYVTTSKRNVLRGMHFQLPPDDHAKIVIILAGRATDVLLDLRKGSHFGTYTSLQLTPEGQNVVFIPKGVAHGFYSHEENTTLLYLVETVHSTECDSGIDWNSFGYEWPCDNPLLSHRDQNHVSLENFISPSEWTFE